LDLADTAIKSGVVEEDAISAPSPVEKESTLPADAPPTDDFLLQDELAEWIELSPVLSVDGCLAPRDPRIYGYPWIGLDWID